MRVIRPALMKICAYSHCKQSFIPTDKGKRAQERQYCSRACNNRARQSAKTGIALRLFWANVQRCSHEWLCPYCCWPWGGCISNDYGVLIIDHKKRPAHQVAWELGNAQSFPKGLQGAHYCHNTSCCNPIHVHPATSKINIGESVRDRRHCFGERHHDSKLVESQVLNVFTLNNAQWSVDAIASHYNVSDSTIRDILAHRTWKYLTIYL
jgi:hypothetical protein